VVRGGAWSDNTYDFGKIQQAPAMLRTPGYGFRTARYADREDIPKAVFGPVQTSQKLDLRAHRPVSDEIFSVYLNQFAYDKDGLDAQPIAVDDGHPDWILERISVAAPYGDERLIINLFLPRSATPPFQTVIYFPGSAALFTASSEDLSDYYEIPLFLGFLMRSGRAVAFPVYQGTFERRDDRYLDIYYGQPSHAYSEYVTQLVKDLRRTVDYLETRDDVDDQRLAYYGMSWGAEIGGVILAVEERMRIAIVMGGGIINAGLSEVNELNYLPHVTVPVLMMNGRYDSLISYESAVLPMFEMIATPAEHKVIKSYPTDHIPSKVDYVTETLNWLDKYFGPVRTVGQPDG
jgi:pimeloyl-ACP methyl ester carboxylesterase